MLTPPLKAGLLNVIEEVADAVSLFFLHAAERLGGSHGVRVNSGFWMQKCSVGGC